MNHTNFKIILAMLAEDPTILVDGIAPIARALSGHQFDTETTRHHARMFLNVNAAEANWLFSADRTVSQLDEFLCNDDEYDDNGYNSHGRDCDGMNATGFDVNGYNCHGFDVLGYDVEGYDSNGYARGSGGGPGLNRSGYDIYGYDIDGLNKHNQSKRCLTAME